MTQLPTGVTWQALQLTHFGLGTQQMDSSQAAHNIDVVTIAAAVTATTMDGAEYRQLFTLAYGLDADEITLENKT